MKGNIDELKTNVHGSKTFGYIFAEDGNSYFFHKSDLKNCTIYSLEEGDSVEFDKEWDNHRKKFNASNVRKTSTTSSSEDIVVNPGKNPNVKYDIFNSEEKEILTLLEKTFYVTRAGEITEYGSSKYKYCIVKPVTEYTNLFNLRREIVVVFSDYITFEPRSLDAVIDVYKRINSKLRLDRCCHILISNDSKIEQRISEILKDSNMDSIVVPFSYSELKTNTNNPRIIEERFRKYLFDADLFATKDPIKNDLFFFGRRDFVQDIATKCKRGENCGVFGLRRSGKTSLLFAVQRQLEREGYIVVFIPCQSELKTVNWKSALHVVVKNIAKNVKTLKEIHLHSENDYKRSRSADYFEEDLSTLLSDLSLPIVLMFDEIESITFGVEGSGEAWRDGNSFVQFWDCLRGFSIKHQSKLSIIIAGTNPMINEMPTISNSNITNPMFGQLSTSNQGAYLPPFNVESTRIMVEALGGYMGIKFNDSIPANLVQDCGGHPYLIRLLCSTINKTAKEKKLPRPIVVTKALYDEAKKTFEISSDAEGFYWMILNILQTGYEKEYNALKILALEGDKTISQTMDQTTLSHLFGYGLIEESNGTYYIRFETIKSFLRGKYKFERQNLSIDDQIKEIELRFRNGERELRKIIRSSLKLRLGEEKASISVINAMRNVRASSHLADSACSLKYRQLFDTTVNKGIFFSVLIEIIKNNFNLFKNVFEGDELNVVMSNLLVLNKARQLLAHPANEDAENWTNKDFEKFRSSMSWLEKIIDANT